VRPAALDDPGDPQHRSRAVANLERVSAAGLNRRPRGAARRALAAIAGPRRVKSIDRAVLGRRRISRPAVRVATGCFRARQQVNWSLRIDPGTSVATAALPASGGVVVPLLTALPWHA
jgi:hypothetical protein